MVEIVIRSGSVDEARSVLEENEPLGSWSSVLDDDYVSVRALFESDELDEVLDSLDRLVKLDERARIVLTPVQATLPRVEEPEEEEAVEEAPSEPARRWRFLGGLGVSREELYTNMSSEARLTRVYVAMVALSAVVASAGILRDNVAVIIGAMVIAPLLGPNISLALATTLGDVQLGRRAVSAALTGLALALGFALALGLLLNVDPTHPELNARTVVGLPDLAIALASGAAAAIAVTNGASTSLVGVMVAVALMPPTVAVGLLFGDGHPREAANAALLLMVNIASVNLAAVAIFLVQGVRPAEWLEERQARRAIKVAVPLWLVALAMLAAGVWLAERA